MRLALRSHRGTAGTDTLQLLRIIYDLTCYVKLDTKERCFAVGCSYI